MAKSNGKRVRRRLWIGILAVAIAGIGVAAARPKAKAEDEKGKIKTAKAEVADVQVRVTEVGSVEPQVKVDVKSVLSGKVVELLVREGDRVKRGQVLARVEPDVNQARDLAQVKNAVSEAEIALAEAKATHERNGGLLGQGLLSDQAGLESETRYRQAKAAFDSAMDKYRIVRESGVPIAMTETGISQRLNVSSPMDGVVIRRPVELGDTVMSGVSSFNAGTVLMTVADVETMIIKAGINEVDIGKVRLEQPVKVSLDAYPKVRFPGHDQAHRTRRAPRGEGQGLRRRDRDRPPGQRAAHRHDRQHRRRRREAREGAGGAGRGHLQEGRDRGRLRQEGRGPEAGRERAAGSPPSSPRARRTLPRRSSTRRTPGRRSSSCARSRPGSRASTRWRS